MRDHPTLEHSRWIARETDKAIEYLMETYGYPVVTDETVLHMLREVYDLAYVAGTAAGDKG